MRKKQKGDCSIYILGCYILVLFMMIGVACFHKLSLQSVKENYDTGLLVSLFGAAIYNREEYGRSGQVVIYSKTEAEEGEVVFIPTQRDADDEWLDAALIRFKTLLPQNLMLSNEYESTYSFITSPIKIDEFRIYNVYESEDKSTKKVFEYIYSENAWVQIEHAENEIVTIAGTERGENPPKRVNCTTVYAKISFDSKVFPFFTSMHENATKRVYMDRCVSVVP